MIELGGAVEVADLSAAEVLLLARSDQRQVWALEARQLELAAHWADLHPADSVDRATAFSNTEVGGTWAEQEEPVAGPGCPLVAEFCVAEFGATLGLTTTSAKRLIGHALELRHRLPRAWARLQTHTVAPWRVRRIAETTIHASPPLSSEAMTFIDDEIAGRAGLIGQRALDRLVEEAVLRFRLLDEDDEADQVAGDAPWFVRFEEVSVADAPGLHVEAVLDLADALELRHALSAIASRLARAGSTESLECRQARALGLMGRSVADDPACDLVPGPRELVVALHLNAIHGPHGVRLDRVLAMDEGQRTVLLTQLQRWCQAPGTVVKIQPVLDLNQPLSSPGYRPGLVLQRHVRMRDRTCVFPYCSRPAAHTDLDHVQPYDPGLPAARREAPPPQSVSSNDRSAVDEGEPRGVSGAASSAAARTALDTGRSPASGIVSNAAARTSSDTGGSLSPGTESGAACAAAGTGGSFSPGTVSSAAHAAAGVGGSSSQDAALPAAASAASAAAARVDELAAAEQQTRSANLGCLCRRHHRLKTHGRWQVASPRSGVFVWTSPHGQRYLRDSDGSTLRLDDSLGMTPLRQPLGDSLGGPRSTSSQPERSPAA